MVKRSTVSHKSTAHKKMSKQTKQLIWILVIMAVAALGFIGAYTLFQSFNKVTYNGMLFTKEKYGEIPVFHYYYFLKHDQVGIVKYNLYLRVDPRKNNVTAEGLIEFPEKKIAYLSIDPAHLTQCEYAITSMGTLTSFLSDNNIKVRGASPNQTLAESRNITFADCHTHPNNPVIIVKAGNKTQIEQDGSKLCYTITVADCDMLSAVEKFEVKTIIDARNNTETPAAYYAAK